MSFYIFGPWWTELRDSCCWWGCQISRELVRCVKARENNIWKILFLLFISLGFGGRSFVVLMLVGVSGIPWISWGVWKSIQTMVIKKKKNMQIFLWINVFVFILNCMLDCFWVKGVVLWCEIFSNCIVFSRMS